MREETLRPDQGRRQRNRDLKGKINFDEDLRDYGQSMSPRK